MAPCEMVRRENPLNLSWRQFIGLYAIIERDRDNRHAGGQHRRDGRRPISPRLITIKHEQDAIEMPAEQFGPLHRQGQK